MVEFVQITIEGFRGIIKAITYKLNSPGINIITGANGAGKSTIVTDALSWVLWKKLVKKGKTSMIPWPSVMDENYKGTLVELQFRVGGEDFTIVRCMDYKGKVDGSMGKNRLIIYANGEELFRDLRGKADHQAWINKKLGYSFDLFKSTVLFTQELDRLMEESGPDKKQIFDEAFESSFIQRAREIVEKRFTQKTKEISELKQTLKILETKLKSTQTQIDFYEKQKQTFEEDKKERLEKIKGKMDDVEKLIQKSIKGIKGCKKNVEVYDKLEWDLEKLQKTIDPQLANKEFKMDLQLLDKESKLETLIAKKNMYIEEYKSKVVACPKCGKKQSPKEIKKTKEKVKKLIEELKPTIQAHTEEIKAMHKVVNDLKENLKKQEEVQKQMRSLEVEKNKLPNPHTNLNDLRKAKKSADHIYVSLEQEYRHEESKQMPTVDINGLYSDKTKYELDIKSNQWELGKDKKKVDIDKWLLNDPLSNSGLKAFIFDSMLKKVNNHLKAYTHLVKFQINIFVDMSMATKPISVSVIRGKEEVPYEDLSKGQKQLVHVALGFALHDAVNEERPINLLIFDEVFESLDPENIEAVWNIIESKKQNKSIHIITHRTQFQPSNAKRIHIAQNSKGQSILA